MTDRVPLHGISSRAWEHPADRAALEALRKVPGFDLLVRKVMSLMSERPLRMITLGSAIEVNGDQYPRVHALYGEVLEVLDAPRRFDLFVSQNPVINAGAVGMDDPFIVLNSGTVQQLSDDQLRVVLAHEVGHILSDHVLYKTMLRLLLRGGSMVLRMPLTGLALLAVVGAMLEWDRKSELSADRASLLAVQDPDVVRAALLRIAGGVGEGASIDAFREQARRYEEKTGMLDALIKTLTLLNQRHPFPVLRLRELDRWIEDGSYAAILNGEYPKRADDPERDPGGYWREAMSSYAEGARSTAEPVGRWFKEKGEGAGKAASSAWDWIRGRENDDVDQTGAGSAEEAEGGAEDDHPVGPDGIIDV